MPVGNLAFPSDGEAVRGGAVDVGAGIAIGNGPSPAHLLVYMAGSHEAFELGIWRGNHRAAVVRGLLFHDGLHGSTRAFRAGRLSGTVEIQRGVAQTPALGRLLRVAGRRLHLHARLLRSARVDDAALPGPEPAADERRRSLP